MSGMDDKEETVEIFSELRNFADNNVHPVVSPENWRVYSKLCDLIDQAEEYVLAMLNEQEPVKAKDCADIVDGIQVGYCPKCDRKIVWNPEKEETVAFCKYCGQAVKWDE